MPGTSAEAGVSAWAGGMSLGLGLCCGQYWGDCRDQVCGMWGGA
eukprot:CAMPEP_0174307704 /NCGR_PEP_ID=MMETSP0810-20121108/1292_1 /TAXON_ID=73025 ORGANISM="Eutreptiella gymnastica-like, Strain CCMP1594" /NCGR_SAMPLE_ID=MMETSP0810 /ASSEMBLY_ACC=CAM_ASM_000659 /LENGTH=43 /DNA_ID= /DNA_START= /DNA_END= /DNA_ORIENTATION=